MFARTILALVPLLVAGAASAQSIGNVKGNVLVNHGTGFVAVAGATPLKIGDTVMARPGASATLNYADGCKVDVIPGAVLTLENISPCALVNAVDPNEPATAQNDPNTPPATLPPPIPPVYIAGGALVAVGAAGLGLGLSDNNNESPVS